MRNSTVFRLRQALIALLCTLLLSACGGSNTVKPRVFAPSASVQELRRSDDNQWTLVLRLQNFSNVAMRMSQVSAELRVDGQRAAMIETAPNLSVPPNNAEPLPVALRLDAAAVAAIRHAIDTGGSISYQLEGRIDSSEPKQRSDEFTFESSLTPVPGLVDTLR